MNRFEPSTILQRLLRGWWLLLALTLLGGLLGRGAALLLPPVYVAQAEYYVSYTLSFYLVEHDMESVVTLDLRDMYNAVTNVVISDDVVDETLRLAGESGVTISADEFRERIRIDRYYSTWMFTVQGRDPETAAVLANAWVQASDSALQDAYIHSRNERRLILEAALLDECLASRDLAKANGCAGTSLGSLAEFEDYLGDTLARLDAESLASRQLDPALRLKLIRLAEPPAEPQRNAPAILLLGGAALGWLLGTILVSAGVLRKK